MDLDKLQGLFEKTLDDGRLTRGERRALGEVLVDLDPSPSDRVGLVGRAFDLARRELRGADERRLLDWLEGLVKTLFPRETPGGHLADAVFAPEEDCASRLRRLFDEAASQVEVCVFTITDNSLVRAILAAHRRGVRVRVLTDDEKTLDLGSDVEHLAKEGIEVRTDRGPEHMHHKFAVFDRRVLVTGSYNWTLSAARHNYENLVLTDDRRLVTSFADEFERLWHELAP